MTTKAPPPRRVPAWARGAFAAAVLLAAAPAFAQASAPRLVIVELERVQLPAPHDKASLGEEMAGAARGAGCEVARVCRAPDCRAADAAARRDVSVLAFAGRYEAARFTCSLRVEVQREAGRGADTRAFSENPVCPAVQLVEDARKAGRRVCEELRAAPRLVAEASREAALPASAAIDLGARAEADGSGWGASRWLGLGVTLAGAGVGALGVVQALESGDPSHCSTSLEGKSVCTRTKSRPLAIPFIAVGTALFGWGLWQTTLGFGTSQADGVTMFSAGGTF